MGSLKGGSMASNQKEDTQGDNLQVDPEKTLDAVWCWDSETGDKILMDRKTNKPIGRWTKSDIEKAKDI